jgi:hypothetical protein
MNYDTNVVKLNLNLRAPKNFCTQLVSKVSFFAYRNESGTFLHAKS